MSRATPTSSENPAPRPSWSERYFRPKAFEFDARLYRWFGVVLFKRALMSLVRVEPGQRASNAYVLQATSAAAVRLFERRSRRSEVIHLLGLSLGALFLLLAVWARPLLVPGLVVIAANLHCFLLQRYNRVRAYRVLDRARRGNRALR